MDKPPPTPTQTLLLAAFVTAAAATLWTMWLPIAWRAVRTGRLLAQGVVYDRQTQPVRYWIGFLGMLTVALGMTAGAAFLITMAVWSFWK